MKFVIDMNLSPLWVEEFKQGGWEAFHWSEIGAANAPDYEIMRWAKENNCIVFTHDLDFGAILAATKTDSPSVIQVRTQDVTPQALKETLFTVINQTHNELETGALVILDSHKLRVRILPI